MPTTEGRPLLPQIGIQNYSTTSSCQARATQVRSDYGTLFVVLVIIGVICFIIIVLGLLYNCWQRRLPKLKHVVSLGQGWGWRGGLESPKSPGHSGPGGPAAGPKGAGGSE